MTVSTPRSDIGRHVFGVAALATGLITLIWHDYHDWDELSRMLNATTGPIFIFAAAAAQIFSGVGIQFRRTATAGAAVLSVVYCIFALLCVPQIVASPKIYNSWGNFFEQLSLATGAVIVYARLSSVWAPETLKRIGRILLGACTASFALEQAFYLGNTASLVPKWIPPNPTFWAIATTVAFALAAVALLTNLKALLATRLLTTMLLIFGLIVWIPLLLADPHSHSNWSETLETFQIAGTAWILADLLGEPRLDEPTFARSRTDPGPNVAQ
jgi:hypothetical protein